MNKKEIFILFLPLWIEAISKNLISFFNIFILNKYSATAAAAISVCGQITYLISIFYCVVTLGTIITLSQALGARDNNKSKEIILNALFFNFITGIFFSIILFFFSKSILVLMGINGEILNSASKYLRISGAFSFLTAIFTTVSSILNCYKLSYMTMIASFSKNILNILLTLFCVLKFNNNVVYAIAGATAISQFFGCLLEFIFLRKKVSLSSGNKGLSIFNKNILKELYEYGLPSALEVFVGHFSSIVIISIISSMGNEYLIARTYVYNLMLFIMPFGTCFGQASQILVGRFFGSKDYNNAYKVCLFSLMLAMICSLSVSLIIFIFGDFFLGIYTQDVKILKLAKPLLKIVIILELGRCINSVCISSLKAVGDVKVPVILGICTMWGIGVIFAKVLGIYCSLGLLGVWLAYSLDEWARGIIILIRWNRKKWIKYKANSEIVKT